MLFSTTDFSDKEQMMATSNGPIQKILHNRNFRLLWIGQGASLLGDQFELIAAPWLVLFANVGLVPVSQALSAIISKFSLQYLFVGAGVLMILLAGWAALNRETRSLVSNLLNASPAD